MNATSSKVGYRLVRNATSTAAKAPYLGVAVPAGSLACGDILDRMLDRGLLMTRTAAQYLLDALYGFAAERIASDIVRINMGAVSLYPMIGGAFDSEDDTYREPRNSLYVGATFSQDVRDTVSGGAPEWLGGDDAKGNVKISSVMDLASGTFRLIDGTNAFRIAGIDLTVPDGEDESLTLVKADGTTKAADIAVTSSEDGQRLVCTLVAGVPPGKYRVRLVSHGLDPTAPLSTRMLEVTVKAATPTGDEPVIERGYSEGEGHSDGKVYPYYAFILQGENLTDAEVKIGYSEGGTPREETVPDEKLTVTDTTVTIASDCVELEDAIAAGGTVTFTVTTPNGSDSYEAEVQE